MRRRPKRSLDASLLALLLTSAQAAPVAGPAVTPDSGVLTPTEHRRTPDQTFLTFPEWYLVHSPAEYAHFLAHAEHPSAFPLFAHIGQFWQSYAAVTKEIQRFPFNGGYHLMVMVIGSSTTVEYTLKGLYEHTIGRLAEATKSEAQVPEERFAAAYAQSYVDFIRVEPWYQYDFLAQFQQLWREVPLRGPDLTRRWERRYLLSCELLVKAGYARLIKLGTQTIYQAPKPTTAVVLDHLPPVDPAHPDFTLLRPAEPGQPVLAAIPRYEGFTTYAKWLAAQDLHFVEVAGNRGDILVSELAPQGWRPHAGRVLFEQPILTEPARQRVAFALPVAQLAQALREAAGAGGSVQVEHIYDF